MKASKLFSKTRREDPSDEISKNAKLLIRAGYVQKEMAGVYNILPLGLRVIEKIKNIIREEMNALGATEMRLTALQNKEVWESTGRWDDEVVDDWFKTALKNGTPLGLAPTHEEPLAHLMKYHISSHKDLPVAVYQFQTKFRNELRAKSGIMRGREFEMKDLYSFSRNKAEHMEFYDRVKVAYKNIYERVGIGDKTYMTISSGGSFSKYSYEFQTVSSAGEDVILVNEELGISINKEDMSDEVLKDFNIPSGAEFKEFKSIEVGDIYTLGDKFSRGAELKFKNENGESEYVFMGSYGIGVPRLMGATVEVLADEKTLNWPSSIAPYEHHLITDGNEASAKIASEIYEKFPDNVYWDDRSRASMGEKLKDYDLLGMPVRIIVSEKSLASGGVEIMRRNEESPKIVPADDIEKALKNM